MQIITYPHPTLRHKSRPVRRVDAELRGLVAQMFELMYASRGIGLAANQVDLPLRLFVMNLEGEQGKGEELVFLNPVVSHPKGSESKEEGCLSLPEVYADVIRPKRVRIQAYGIDGREFDAEVDGLFARCVQHEVDHLDGILFIDRVNPTMLPELHPALDEFEADFESRRATGGIANDDELAARRTTWEQRYC